MCGEANYDTTYLDHAAAAVYSEKLIENYCKELCSNTYGNPHSGSDSSQLTDDIIQHTRERILRYFSSNVDDYSVVFTSGCTQALSVLAQTFQFETTTPFLPKAPADSCNKSLTPNKCQCPSDSWVYSETNANAESPQTCNNFGDKIIQPHSHSVHSCCDLCEGFRDGGVFFYFQDNHTSVVGMREVVMRRGYSSHCIPCENVFKALREPQRSACQCLSNFRKFTSSEYAADSCQTAKNLLVFPSQSNFNGQRYPLHWVKVAKKGQLIQGQGPLYVCLDAASHVSTSPLDLSVTQPDFVCLSFYKIFGFPTGLGALLVKNSAVETLDKVYFGGGTVQVVIPKENYHVKRPSISDRFEDGTGPYLQIVALYKAFLWQEGFLSNIGGLSVSSRFTFELSRFVYSQLCALTHGNGTPVAVCYHDNNFGDSDQQGPIINFNLLHPDGSVVGYSKVSQLAQLCNIHLRTGCMCNTGACQFFLELTSQQLKENFKAGHVCGDDVDLIHGQPTGSCRISFGWYSTFKDAFKFLQFIHKYFVSDPQKSLALYEDNANEALERYLHIHGVEFLDIFQNGMLARKDHCSDGQLVDVEAGSLEAKLVNGGADWTEATSSLCSHGASVLNESARVLTDSEMTQSSGVLIDVTSNRTHAISRAALDSGNNDGPYASAYGLTNSTDALPDSSCALINSTNARYPSTDDLSNSTREVNTTGVFTPSASALTNSTAALCDSAGVLSTHSASALVNSTAALCDSAGVLSTIIVYPVKSCAGFSVTRWPIGPTGLHYDRHWAVVNEVGVCLSQKRMPTLCLIGTRIDLDRMALTLSYPGYEDTEVSLAADKKTPIDGCSIKVCRERVLGWDCGDTIALWLCQVLQCQGLRLVQQSDLQTRSVRGNTYLEKASLSYANEAQYLLINKASVEVLKEFTDKQDGLDTLDQFTARFRGNLIVDGFQPFAEESWSTVMIGQTQFRKVKLCTRCQMISIDQSTAQKSPDTLIGLIRMKENKNTFGLLLNVSAAPPVSQYLQVAQEVTVSL